MSPDHAHRPRHRIWRLLRIYFRRFRITIWLSLLAVVGIFVYLNQIGLPGFVKRPLLDNLRAHGIDLQFTRLHLDWADGIVADHVRFGRPDDPESPYLTVREVKVGLNRPKLVKFAIQIDSLTLRNGTLVWPVVESNRPPRQISLQNIETDLRFLPGDQWELDNFRAAFSTANIRLSGTVTNASAIRDWQFLKPRQPKPEKAVDSRLRQFADLWEQIGFSAPPDLNLEVQGDARDLQSFAFRLLVAAPGAVTPWGALHEGRLSVKLHAATNQVSHAELNLEAANAQTRWGNLTNLLFELRGASHAAETNLVHAEINLHAESLVTKWASASNTRLSGIWTHSLTNPVPISGQGEIFWNQASTKWGSTTNGHLKASLATPPPGAVPPCDPSWGWWTNLHPYAVDWQIEAGWFVTPKLSAREVAMGGSWLAPLLNVTNLQAQIADGSLTATADLNVDSRRLNTQFKTRVDPRRLSLALPQEVNRLLSQFTLQAPIEAQAEATLTLPSWTNSTPAWPAIRPSLVLDGHLHIPAAAGFRGVQMAGAESTVSYSNLVWTLPDLHLRRSEGELRAYLQASDRTSDFYASFNSTIDPGCLRPLAATNQHEIFNLASFAEPPRISVIARGNFKKPDTLQVRGSLAATNVTFRGEQASGVQASFQYSNQVITVIEPRVQRGAENLSADCLVVDLPAEVIYLTNGCSTADPMFITRAIGANVARAIEPYHFFNPPSGRANGIIPLRGEEKADIHFEVDGGPFHWWKLNLARVKGKIHWKGNQVSLKDVEADFYGGYAAGIANIDFSKPHTTIYNFTAATTNATLQPLVRDVFGTTNRLDGFLNAELVVTHANSALTHDFQGYGKADLRDGFLWDLPIFGVLTPVLNGISPGLGNSRASSASCTFTIENAVVKSRDMVIRAEGMRLKYSGGVDLEGRTDARVEAEVLRDMWLVGPLVSSVLWPVTKMFDYKVTGTLGNPDLEPVYIFPKLMRIPLQPFRTLKGLLPESNSGRTNAPPAAPKQP